MTWVHGLVWKYGIPQIHWFFSLFHWFFHLNSMVYHALSSFFSVVVPWFIIIFPTQIATGGGYLMVSPWQAAFTPLTSQPLLYRVVSVRQQPQVLKRVTMVAANLKKTRYMAEMMVASIYYNSSKWLGLSSGGRLHINIHIIYIRIYTCSSRCAWCDLNWLMWWNVRCIRFTHTHTQPTGTHSALLLHHVASKSSEIGCMQTTYIERYMYRVNFKTNVGGSTCLVQSTASHR